MPFLVAYDIADPGRLRRVARLLERRARRLQWSVFLFRGGPTEVAALLDEAARLIEPANDVIQAWPVPGNGTPALTRGTPHCVAPLAVVLGGSRALFVAPSVLPTRSPDEDAP